MALLSEKQNHQSETNSSQEQPQNNNQNENQSQNQAQSNDEMETETDVKGTKRPNPSVSSNDDDTLVNIETPNLARDSKRSKAGALSLNQEEASSGKGQTPPANLSTTDNNTPSGSGEKNPIIADDSNAADSDSGKSTDDESESSLNTGKQEVPANKSNRGPRTQSLDRDASSRQRSRSPLGQKKDKKHKVKGGAKLSPKNIFQRNFEKIKGPK